jgi:hypothetical protein
LRRPSRTQARSEDGVAVIVMERLVNGNGRAWLMSRSSRPDIANIDLRERDEALPSEITVPMRVRGSFIPE